MTALVVKSFGVFWERERVEFGVKGPGNKGHLFGHSVKATVATDFRMQRGIYVLYEGTDINFQRIVNIGQVGSGDQRLLARLRAHTSDHLWNRWQRFSWLGLLEVGADNELAHSSKQAAGGITVGIALDQLEASLIQLMEPLLNRQGPKWHGAVEYFQGQP